MYSKKKWFVFVILCSSLILGFLHYGGERRILLGRMFDQPGRIGSIAPSSKNLASLMAKEALSAAENSEGFVIEIGPGTGCITRVLLEQGIAAERLVCVEIDPALHQYMIERFPEVQTILGDAADLDTILPEGCGEVDAVVSGVPLKNLPTGKEEEIIQACCAILKPSGKFIQFTYGVRPPTNTLGLHRKFAGFVLFNVPPAFVWSFTKA
jgi:phosphatidylethanolamine/phosphatidyl-N-methylethanolamine N-methyltransferase